MKKKLTFVSLGVLAIFLITSTAFSASLDYDIPWWTMEAGGVSQSGNYYLRSVIGQPDASNLSGGDFNLTGGFLGIRKSSQNKVYLPLVQR